MNNAELETSSLMLTRQQRIWLKDLIRADITDWQGINGLTLLPPLPDTSELEQLLAEADTIQNVGYTDETWTRYLNARQYAISLIASGDYTESEISYALYELQSAINGLALVEIPPIEPPPSAKGYNLATGDISGYIDVVPKIFYNYVLSAKPVYVVLFGVILGILVVPRLLSIIFPRLRR